MYTRKMLHTLILYKSDGDSIGTQFTTKTLDELSKLVPEPFIHYLDDAVHYGSEKVVINNVVYIMFYNCWSVPE